MTNAFLVLVLVFKLVIRLERKRRDTNKKVLAVMIEMQDMMSALLLSVLSVVDYSH